MVGGIADGTNEMVRYALDAASLRHLVHAHNIANANTPGFVPLKTTFSQRLDSVMRGNRDGASAAVRDLRVEPDYGSPWGGAATVNLDWEVAKISQNAVQYQSLLRALSGKMAIVALAVSEGRR